MSTTPKTQITELSPTAANQAPVVNSGWAIVDQLLDRTVKDKDLATPPGIPADGDAYIVAASPTGLWTGKTGQIAYWRASAGVWQFIVPKTGWTVRVSDELDSNGLPKEYGFDGANWELVAGVTTPVQDEGSTVVASPTAINFVGAGVTVTDVGGVATVTISGGGAGGVAPALQYTCETGSTADSDPGAGLMKWNHATQASATQLFIDDLTADAVSMTALWGQLAPNGFLLIQKVTDANTWQLWKFTSITAATGYVKLGVTLIADGGALTDGDALLLEFDNGASGGGGLTNLTEAKITATPNATVPVVSLSVTITETSGDMAYVAKGNGATLAQVPNNAATGGNKRGIKATDWQKERSAATQVASGDYSAIGGGSGNETSGTYSVIAGGLGNWGISNYGFIGSGDGNTNSSAYGVIGGGYLNTTGTDGYSVVSGGANNLASGQFATINGGYYATTRGVYGAAARASGRFSVQGDAQRERFTLRRATADATAAVLSANNGAPIATNQITLPDSSAYGFAGRVVARASATGDCASWEFKGTIKRGANAAATALVAAVTPTLVAGDSGASAWAIAVTADTTNGALAITVTGVAATNIKWVADIETVEVVG
ncbi:DUF2793 domain-containing protein [Pseudomonas cavernicola]|uniref:DUF2793 domain-containing protein n=1 Tax=Pseudomonas cavernicola TaxID=2320866 RepID=A0A418XEE7_9PSED|nr:DUF2793 domain-containing protein [Pseudomonas cavernicola]RJG10902.1 DUF2793 domain-containing protein [Pseudomonas cavernicola]